MENLSVEQRRQTKAGRVYDIDGLGAVPSVTSILQAIGKPALVNWAANEERKMVLDASFDLYSDTADSPRMNRIGWMTTMANRLGKAKAHSKALAKASDIGSQAHQLIEWNLKARMLKEPGPSPAITPKAQWAFMAWEDWAKMVNLKPIFVEEVVASETHLYAGTLDLYGEVDLAGMIGWYAKKERPVPEVLTALAVKQKTALAVADWKTGKAIYDEAYLQNAALRFALREMSHGDSELGLIVRLPKNESDPEFEVAVCPDERESMKIFLSTMCLWKWLRERDSLREKASPKAAE